MSFEKKSRKARGSSVDKQGVVRQFVKTVKETNAEEERRDGGAVYHGFLKLMDVILSVFSVYLVGMVSATMVVPSVVGYMAGVSGMGDDVSLYGLLAAWVFPSLFMVVFISVIALYASYRLCRFWHHAFNRMWRSYRKKLHADSE